MAEVKEKTGNMYYKGTWRYCSDYQPGDVVIHGGDMYIALEQSAGMYPDDPLNSKYWRLMFANIGPAVTEHNALSGIQGGDGRGEYYHLTADQRGAAEYATAPSAENPFVTLADVPYLDRRVTEFALVEKPAGTGMLYSAVHAGDVFIAVGDDCVITSPDALKWTEIEDAPNGNWRGAAHGGGAVSVVGLNGKGLWSGDGGVTFEETVMPEHDWNDVCFGNGMFIAVGDGKTAYSLDGKTRWTALDAPKGYGESIAFDNGRFVSVGPAGARSTRDGETWTESETPEATWRGVAFGGGRFAAVAGKCMSSADGVNGWELHDDGLPSGGWDSLCYGGGFFVGVGSSSNVIISETPNERAPLKWEQRSVPNYVLRDAVYGADRFVAVGGGIMVAYVVDVAAALAAANMPSGSNPFLTAKDIDAFNDGVDEKIGGLRDELNGRIDGLSERVDGWDKRLDDTIHEVDRRLDLTDERMDRFDERLDDAEKAIAAGGAGGGGGMTPAEKAQIEQDIKDINDAIDEIKRDIAAGGGAGSGEALKEVISETVLKMLGGVFVKHVVTAAEERGKAFSIDGEFAHLLLAFGGVVQTPDTDYALSAADGKTAVSWNGRGLDAIGVKAGDVFVIAAIGGEGGGSGAGGGGMTAAEKAELERRLGEMSDTLAECARKDELPDVSEFPTKEETAALVKSLNDANKAIAALEKRIEVLEGKHEEDEDDDGDIDVKVDGGEIKVP